ncbi:hypothetical protein [Massilia varians]|uniref:hypothetical protein n=1 Tax=Massilia varians TaxID=457921 RepID=UPI0025522B27|nr:hypothetical protein [Massilia varians]MDK6077941.1 hypothetical protein [Massilia varians]
MTFGISAVAWAGIAAAGATVYSANKQSKAAKSAAQSQSEAAQAGIDESNARFEAVRQLLAPFVDAGTGALAGQQDLLGLKGADAQRNAIGAIQASPQFGALAQQGEEAILANSSATGGLRGGNTQGALAQFRPQLLAQLIDQQYARLGGLTSLGQNAAAGVGNAGMQTGVNVANLLGQQGAAQAGAALAAGKADAQMANGLASAFGNYMGGKF